VVESMPEVVRGIEQRSVEIESDDIKRKISHRRGPVPDPSGNCKKMLARTSTMTQSTPASAASLALPLLSSFLLRARAHG
jgi:hypothetical protein